MASDMHDTYPVCEAHKAALAATLGDRLRFYLLDNSPALGHVTLCEAHATGCKNPAAYRFDFRLRDVRESMDSRT
jgi:hypothetical protein